MRIVLTVDWSGQCHWPHVVGLQDVDNRSDNDAIATVHCGPMQAPMHAVSKEVTIPQSRSRIKLTVGNRVTEFRAESCIMHRASKLLVAA